MPTETAALSMDLTFDDVEFAKLAAGELPEQMEDKWFIYYEQPWLNVHRSWTGFCLYKVRLASQRSQHRVIEAIANRNRDQYREQSEKQDALLLTILLFNRVGRDSEPLWQEYGKGLPSSGPKTS